MLKPVPFATSLAIISGVLYLVLYVLTLVWPQGFRFFFMKEPASRPASFSRPRLAAYQHPTRDFARGRCRLMKQCAEQVDHFDVLARSARRIPV